MIKRLLVIIFVYSTLTTNLYSIEPDVFVQSTVNRASKLLSENITKEEKINQLKQVAKETVDINGVGLYSLGPIRKSLNNNQKKKIY